MSMTNAYTMDTQKIVDGEVCLFKMQNKGSTKKCLLFLPISCESYYLVLQQQKQSYKIYQ